MRSKVVIRADGNREIGMGHFMRCIGIAEILKENFECNFFTTTPTEYQKVEVEKHCVKLVELPNDEKSQSSFVEYLKGDEIVLMDNYSFTSEFLLQVRNKGCKVVYIDDFNDKFYTCDVLINNIPGFARESFNTAPYTRLCLGTDYALLRKEFLNPHWRQATKIKDTVFMSFGGSDINNLSRKFTQFIKTALPSFTVDLLVGDVYSEDQIFSLFDHVNVYKNIPAEKVAELMASAQVCIVPASSLLNEAACIGSNILLGYFTENQRQPYNYFVANKLAVGLGDYRLADIELFKLKIQETIDADFLIGNQKKIYRGQQIENLKNIFFDAQQD